MNTYDACYSAVNFPQVTGKKTPLFKTVAPFMVYLAVVGTGGMMTAHSLEKLDAQIYEPQLHIESFINKIDTRSPAEQVAFIREMFALNMSDLANVLNVTRPTIYAWLEGQEPKPEMLNRIQQISQVANKLQSLNISRVDIVVRRPIFDGRSLLDKLKANENTLSYLAVLKKVADKEEQARHALKGSNKNIRLLSDVVNDYSPPLYNKS